MKIEHIGGHETIGNLAAEIPGATRLFERLGIDYCCGGSKTVEEAAQLANLEPVSVINALTQLREEAFVAGNGDAPRDWLRESLSSLIEHILATHHRFTRDELERLEKLLVRVCNVHAERHPELIGLNTIFLKLRDDLLPHLLKEEQILFPYVTRLESAIARGSFPQPPTFGTVRNPVRMMMIEHDTAGDLLREMRQASGGYILPEGACASYRALFEGLVAFEADLHQHIHLENNILFPRSITLETDAVNDI